MPRRVWRRAPFLHMSFEVGKSQITADESVGQVYEAGPHCAGSVPTTWGELARLQNVSVAGNNNLSGPLPPRIAALASPPGGAPAPAASAPSTLASSGGQTPLGMYLLMMMAHMGYIVKVPASHMIKIVKG